MWNLSTLFWSIYFHIKKIRIKNIDISSLWLVRTSEHTYIYPSISLPLSLSLSLYIYIYIYIYIHKVGDYSWGQPEGSLFNSYCTEVLGRARLLSLDCSTLPLIRTLYCWVLSKEVLSTIFKVFGMTRPGIETRSLGPLANTLPTWKMSRSIYKHYNKKS